jgi:hypothetical protein
LTTRTSLSRISCHSSVVKVQQPRRDGPRRRRRMMRLGGRGVKPATLMTRASGTTRATPEEAARRRMVWGSSRAVKRGLTPGSVLPISPHRRQAHTTDYGQVRSGKTRIRRRCSRHRPKLSVDAACFPLIGPGGAPLRSLCALMRIPVQATPGVNNVSGNHT